METHGNTWNHVIGSIDPFDLITLRNDPAFNVYELDARTNCGKSILDCGGTRNEGRWQ